MPRQLTRLASEERGQDLIEYALLAAVIAIVGMVGMDAISAAMNASYDSWDGANHGLWEPPAPSTP